jgi:NAD(P)-dependent dehydrogenase (short-subunit alcohol dehydrogenase family)
VAGPGKPAADVLGIGAAICENLAAKGANIVLNYTSESSAQRTDDLAHRLSAEYSVKTVVVRADMGTVDGPKDIVRVARDTFSAPEVGMRIHVIINNAGVSGNKTLEDCTSGEFARQYHVNVRGPMLLVRAAQRYLPVDRSGRIVNLSSVSSSLGFVGQTIYGGTKAALEAMTRTWARELAENATVNAINPGPVATDMVSFP